MTTLEARAEILQKMEVDFGAMESQEKFEIYWPLERKYWHDFEPFGKNHRSLCLKRQVSKSKFRSQKWESKRKSNLFKDLFKNEPTNIKGIWNLPYHMKKRNKKHQNAKAKLF